jgi:hypothetical protein
MELNFGFEPLNVLDKIPDRMRGEGALSNSSKLPFVFLTGGGEVDKLHRLWLTLIIPHSSWSSRPSSKNFNKALATALSFDNLSLLRFIA